MILSNIISSYPYNLLSPKWFRTHWETSGFLRSSGDAWNMSIHMLVSSNGNIFRVTGPLCGEFTDPGEFPAQRPVTRGFDVFFDLRLKKRLSNQPWGWWFETPSWPLWRQCHDTWIWRCRVISLHTCGSLLVSVNSFEHICSHCDWCYLHYFICMVNMLYEKLQLYSCSC